MTQETNQALGTSPNNESPVSPLLIVVSEFSPFPLLGWAHFYHMPCDLVQEVSSVCKLPRIQLSSSFTVSPHSGNSASAQTHQGLLPSHNASEKEVKTRSEASLLYETDRRPYLQGTTVVQVKCWLLCVCFPRLLPLVVLLYCLANTNGNPRRLRMRSTGRGCSDASSCNSGCKEDVKTHKTVFMVHEISVVFSSRAYHQSGSGDAVGPRHIGTHSDCGNWYKA